MVGHCGGHGAISPVGSPFMCVSCPSAVMTPPIAPSPGDVGYHHMGYRPVQQCSTSAQGYLCAPPLHHGLPTGLGTSGSPVLSLCSGRSDYSHTVSSPAQAVQTMNPGLNLLCQAMEEAHTPRSETPAVSRPIDAPRVKGPWRAEEDRLLCDLVEKFGPRRWTAIASFIAGRTGKQSRERWLNHLNPHLSKRPWTEEEDKIIMKAHRDLGNKWSEIAKLLNGRTDNSVKNRFNTTIRRQISEYSYMVRSEGTKRQHSDIEDDDDSSTVTTEPIKKRQAEVDKSSPVDMPAHRQMPKPLTA